MKTSFALSALRRLRGGKQGFSLVEVTIALGVTAFALVALFGMLPTGLNLFRSSMDTSIKSQIVQELNSEALLADFTDLIELSKTDPQLRYFDDNGKDVTEIGGESASIYTAQVKVIVPDAQTFSRDNAPPTGDSAALVRVQVHVARNPSHQSPDALFVDPPAKMPPGVDVYNIYVAKNK